MSDSEKLSVAIVHHHLRGGGVTRIIENTLHALQNHPVEPMVFVGEALPHGSPIPNEKVRVVKGLGYAGDDGPPLDADSVYRNLKQDVEAEFGGAPDLWHIHNHSLGKNPAVTDAVVRLAADGENLLLQLHDFAEDGRPPNYQRLLNYGKVDWDSQGRSLIELMYPAGTQVHYAFLNGRDRKIFTSIGLATEDATILSNPVVFNTEDRGEASTGSDEYELPEPLTESKPLVIYPTRAIRRKNMGEMLFWSALYGDEVQFAATLAPKNPEMKPVYERWKSLAGGNGLHVFFELGEKWEGPFEELLRKADALLSTSIMEGFGLAFLEPWLVDRPIIGRNLADITRDFSERGIRLDHLYTTLQVPLAKLKRDKLKKHIAERLESLYAAYGQNFDEQTLQEIWEQLTDGGTIDFGVLDEPFQQELIEQAIRGDLKPEELNPQSLEIETLSANEELIRHNKELIKNGFNLDDYGDRLAQLYQEVAHRQNDQEPNYLDAGRILKSYLSSENFTLLKT